jgi:hypothetical protein
MWRTTHRTLLYLWVAPGSLVGLLAAAIARRQGGCGRMVDGVLEVTAGPLLAVLSRYSAVGGGIRAITLGHVVLAADAESLDSTRLHERVHVRQYERWGPLFIPAYLACSGWLWLRGRNPYLENPFEIEAYRAER